MRTDPSLVDFWYFMVVGESESVMPFSGIRTDKCPLAPVINLPATLMWTTLIKFRGSHTQTGLKLGRDLERRAPLGYGSGQAGVRMTKIHSIQK